MAFNSHTNGYMIFQKTSIGNAIDSRIFSVLMIAIDFGVSSPSMMWHAVMRVNASAKAIV